jgi:hypothetical protein
MRRKPQKSLPPPAGPTSEDGAEGAVNVGGFNVRSHSMVTQILLEAIDHPILKAVKEGGEALDALVLDSTSALTLIFIFVEPDEAWRTNGYSRANFLASARDFAFRLPPSAVDGLVTAIKGELVRQS